MSGRTLTRLADAGVIGPIVFGVMITILTFLEYDFLIGLGWDPIYSSAVPWPSALALGPYGYFQAANFVFFGVCLISFGLGLHRGVRAVGRTSWAGPALVIMAGIAMVLLGFKADPRTSGLPQTWHGWIHALAFLVVAIAILAAFFVLWRRLKRDPLWSGYGSYTLISGILCTILLFMSFMDLIIPGQVAFYLFLVVMLAWIEVMAIRLRSIAMGARSGRAVPAG
ncbi:MAG TPA: DUF998 domain-containing protein [Rubrobacter sp.]|nr:DUF998 domain-containing protein [Rubrobacter sp.]